MLKILYGAVCRVIREVLDWIIWRRLRICPNCGEKSFHLKTNSILSPEDRTLLMGVVPMDEIVLATCINCGCQHVLFQVFYDREEKQMPGGKVLIVENNPDVRATPRSRGVHRY